MATRVSTGSPWSVKRVPARGAARRRGAADASLVPPMFLQSKDVVVEEVLEAQVPAGRRGALTPELPLEVDVRGGERSVIAIRHASGAITFHSSVERGTARGRRRGAASGTVERYRIPIRGGAGPGAGGRRGLISAAIKFVVLKIAKAAADKAVSIAMPILARQVEKLIWSNQHISEGWFKVTPGAAPPSLTLTPGTPPAGQRSLVLIHGTFSNAASAFNDLAAGPFFDRVKPLYGDRVFAFNHFSISRTPVDNAQLLVSGLKSGTYAFDAISHSRGGLVLRALVEQRDQLGSPSVIVNMGQGVMVASPNDGTPLATPARWEDTFGWFANLLEVFPDNPFTSAAGFISEGLVWIASHLAGDLPGLRSMDAAGDLIKSLQLPPGPPANTYSALVSNFHPDASLFARALDVGVDSFFASANDLVVPSEGGWRVDHDGVAYVPGSRIGCFGPGGNIASDSGAPIHHLNFFAQQQSVDFLAKAVDGKPHGLPSVDPNAQLPSHRLSRRAGAGTAQPAIDGTAAAMPRPAAAPLAAAGAPGLQEDRDTFHIVVMDDFDAVTGQRNRKDRKANFFQIYASYGGARVTVPMRVRRDERDKNTTTLFGKIIATHTRIQDYTNMVKGSLPDDDELQTFGAELFDTLFQGEVRRLYDEARSRQRGQPLDLVLTSMIPWIGEKPWEFAFDRSRASFLATEEIHFVRNVLTLVPADPIIPVAAGLRILVAAAQPVSFGILSIEEELTAIRKGFQPLIEAGLVQIDVLARATPSAIHGYLSTGHYNVVHFIGHGEFKEDPEKKGTGEGFLIFEDANGGPYPLGERSTREIFCQRGLSLVFLNACQSGTGGRADFNKGVAQALVSHGLPALVANQYSVLDSSASSFAQHFYFSLAQGMSIGQSAREARIAVNYALEGDPIDWAVPVVYARDASRALCVKPAAPLRVPATIVRSTHRRAVRGRVRKIAVWDIDDVFPNLDQTLRLMNDAQDVFGFEEAKMSLPLDVWDLESVPGTRYLDAGRLAERLNSKPGSMHVDLLVCITRNWMGDSTWMNLYAWWDDPDSSKVAVVSFAGFDELKPTGPETDRVVANTLVSVLAGFFGNQDTHKRSPRNCPLAFNQERAWENVAGQLKFDGICRKKLRPLLGRELPALDALLQRFKP